jgi:phosphoglycerate dehydrogenase-like enzyme
VRLVTVDGSGSESVAVLWRRQWDRTAWALSAIANTPHLRWIHTDTAGVDRLPLEEIGRRGITLTNAHDVHTPAVSEWALGALLLAAKRFDDTVRASDARVWGHPGTALGLQTKTLMILGMGSIGTSLGRMAHALQMDVVGVTRSGRSLPDFPRVFARAGNWLPEVSKAAFLVNALPYTPATKSLVDAEIFSRMDTSAWFINVGRGETVDEAALCQALDRGAIAGAILDAVADEPLSPSSPLWGRPNVMVSPHVSSFNDLTESKTRGFFEANLARYLAGERLEAVVDLERGY